MPEQAWSLSLEQVGLCVTTASTVAATVVAAMKGRAAAKLSKANEGLTAANVKLALENAELAKANTKLTEANARVAELQAKKLEQEIADKDSARDLSLVNGVMVDKEGNRFCPACLEDGKRIPMTEWTDGDQIYCHKCKYNPEKKRARVRVPDSPPKRPWYMRDDDY